MGRGEMVSRHEVAAVTGRRWYTMEAVERVVGTAQSCSEPVDLVERLTPPPIVHEAYRRASLVDALRSAIMPTLGHEAPMSPRYGCVLWRLQVK